jgi:Maltose operon periplasmic protein precursor (MalM)
MMRLRWRLAALLPLLVLACKGPAIKAVTALDGRTCAALPDLGTAVAVPLDADKDVTVKLDATAPCLAAGDGDKSTYAAFLLPEASEPYLLSVTSEPSGTTLFSPRALLLDAGGTTLRELPRDAFMFHGTSLYLGLRARPGERYLVVASDPRSVGESQTQIAGATQTSGGSLYGGGFFTYATGSERTRILHQAHSGTVSVAAKPLPKAELSLPPPAPR